MPHPYLKGSRKLIDTTPNCNRRNLQSARGAATGGATAVGSGSAETNCEFDPIGDSGASGSGEFVITSGSSGFADTMFGSAVGSAASGATGSQNGKAEIVFGGLGTLAFDGTTTSSGTGGFGADFSPVGFNSVTTEEGTTVTPFSTGPTGGSGTGKGDLSIASKTTGMLMANINNNDVPPATIGTASSGGKATNVGGGMGSGSNLFGTAGGLGSGAATGAAASAGNTKLDVVNGIFSGLSEATGNFDNQGSGNFGGRPTTLAFSP
jgi:hypothetical protein